MEKLFKIIISGIVAGMILFIVSSIVYNYTGHISDPSLSHIFREKISMKWFYKLLIITAGTGIIMSIFYSIIYTGLPGGNIFKGIFWGFIVWLIIVHQPLITMIVIGKFTMDLLVSWIIQGLVSYVAAGISISLIYKN
ncbi:MAG: hypothetical protein KA120_00835 [Candidatus Goldbacteria bacterium]|nr:hypothetical protein [Candidatus Goldiibacteriota bacterium]